MQADDVCYVRPYGSAALMKAELLKTRTGINASDAVSWKNWNFIF